MSTERPLITPKSRILEIIECFPQLEQVLIAYVPAFEKLKNPLLRATVARVATLQQAASIGNVRVEDLVNHLRSKVGQDAIDVATDPRYTTVRPSWFTDDSVAHEFDIRPMLAAGEQPVNQVMADLNELKPGRAYKLIAPFLPAPLIDKATSLGLSHWIDAQPDGTYWVFFSRSS